MSDDTDPSGEGDEETNRLRAEIRDTDQVSAEITVSKSITEIREGFINQGEVAPALLLVSVRVEHKLARLIRERFDITNDQFDDLGWNKKSMGAYFHMCRSTNISKVQENTSIISRLIEERSKLAHDKGHYYKIQTKDEKRDEVKNLLREVLEFLED